MTISRILASMTLALGLCLSTATVAQQQPRAGDPPYEQELTRLAELLGSLHYLRELCGAKEGQLWRDKMAEILESEAPSDVRRARLIDSFNRGYRGYRNTYTNCTESAGFLIERYLKEGEEISARIAARYGN